VQGGFTAFSFPITQALQPEAINLLAIKVNSKLDAWTLPPSGVDWFNYGGIYRPVEIQTTSAAFIDDYTLKTRMDGAVSLSVNLVNAGSFGSYRLVARIADQMAGLVTQVEIGLELGSGERREVKLSLAIPNPCLWKLNASYLYNLRLELLDTSGGVSDSVEKRFGVREFGMAGQRYCSMARSLCGCAA
jgi:beta-glucuronidase